MRHMIPMILILSACVVPTNEGGDNAPDEIDAAVAAKGWGLPGCFPSWVCPDAALPVDAAETLSERKSRLGPHYEEDCRRICARQHESLYAPCAPSEVTCTNTCINEYWTSPTSCFWAFDAWVADEWRDGPALCGSWTYAPWAWQAQDERQAFLECRFGWGGS